MSKTLSRGTENACAELFENDLRAPRRVVEILFFRADGVELLAPEAGGGGTVKTLVKCHFSFLFSFKSKRLGFLFLSIFITFTTII